MLSTKKLLYKLTNRVRPAERFPVQSASSKFGTNYNSVGEYFPATDTVIFTFSWRASSNVTGSDVLFTLPPAYRPASTWNCSGIVVTDTSIVLGASYSVNAAGEIHFDGSTSYGRNGYGVLVFPI